MMSIMVELDKDLVTIGVRHFFLATKRTKPVEMF